MQSLLLLSHWVQEGRLSSHLMRRFLQLAQPVFTLGLLLRFRFTGACVEGPSADWFAAEGADMDVEGPVDVEASGGGG